MGLTGMGFPEGRSKKALVLTGNDVEAAIEWLAYNENDPTADDPLPPPPKPMKSVAGTTFTPDAVVSVFCVFCCLLVFFGGELPWPRPMYVLAPRPPARQPTRPCRAAAPPSPSSHRCVARSNPSSAVQAFRGLQDMGFAERDVLAALQLARNDMDGAVSFGTCISEIASATGFSFIIFSFGRAYSPPCDRSSDRSNFRTGMAHTVIVCVRCVAGRSLGCSGTVMCMPHWRSARRIRWTLISKCPTVSNFPRRPRHPRRPTHPLPFCEGLGCSAGWH